jgi:hypothetical protein
MKRQRPGTDDHLTFFVFSKWMNSCRSLDNGRIWVFGHDQFKQQLQFFISGQPAAVLVVGVTSFFKRKEFTHDLFHVGSKNIR